MVTAVGQDLVARRPTGRVALDVVDAGRHALPHGRQQGGTLLAAVEPVAGEHPAPPTSDLPWVAAGLRFDERPAQVGHVLDPSTWAGLLPVDQADRSPVPDHDVAGLQVVVDQALGAVGKPGRERSGQVVELADHADQRLEVDLRAVGRGVALEPGQHLEAVVDATGAWRPRRPGGLEAPQHVEDQRRVGTDGPPHGLAVTARTIAHAPSSRHVTTGHRRARGGRRKPAGRPAGCGP